MELSREDQDELMNAVRFSRGMSRVLQMDLKDTVFTRTPTRVSFVMFVKHNMLEDDQKVDWEWRERVG